MTGFTGIDQTYEVPESPELTLRAGELSIDECVQQVVELLQRRVTPLKSPFLLLVLFLFNNVSKDWPLKVLVDGGKEQVPLRVRSPTSLSALKMCL